MRNLLYMVAILSALIGAAAGYYYGSIQLISSGLLASVLFGIMGKVCHLLETIEDHLRVMRETRFRGLLADRYPPPRGKLYVAGGTERRSGMPDRRAQ